MPILITQGKQIYFGSNGLPLVGGKLYAFYTDTEDPKSTWHDRLGEVENQHPIILDSRGECNAFFSGVYTLRLTDATGTLIWEIDGVLAVSGTISYDKDNNLIFTPITPGPAFSIDGVGGIDADIEYHDDSVVKFSVGVDATDNDYKISASGTLGTTDAVRINDVTGALTFPNDVSFLSDLKFPNGLPAASVPIVDVGGYFTATNIDTALQELGANPLPLRLSKIIDIVVTGVYTPTVGTTAILVKGVGGGGGGAPLVGGGAGGYFEELFVNPNDFTPNVTITIGAGGPGGVGGGAGSNGGTTTFGTLCSATGGIGGIPAPIQGGLGGIGVNSNINIVGGGGGGGGSNGGTGGNSLLGPGAKKHNADESPNSPPNNTGGGGGGGGFTATIGSAGSAGRVIIYEFTT